MEFFERFLTLYGPLGLGWILAGLLMWVLYRHAGQYIRALTQSADGASAVGSTLESLENSLTHAIGKHSERLDRMESELAYMRSDTSESVGLLRRVTKARE